MYVRRLTASVPTRVLYICIRINNVCACVQHEQKWGGIDYFVCFAYVGERGVNDGKLLYFTEATARHPSISGTMLTGATRARPLKRNVYYLNIYYIRVHYKHHVFIEPVRFVSFVRLCYTQNTFGKNGKKYQHQTYPGIKYKRNKETRIRSALNAILSSIKIYV